MARSLYVAVLLRRIAGDQGLDQGLGGLGDRVMRQLIYRLT